MSKIRLTKEFSFEMAHALHHYDGKCAYIHGHSYHLSVTIIGTPVTDENNPKLGMVMDFSVLKKIVNQEILELFDHALVLKDTDPLAKIAGEPAYERVIRTLYQPTCENLLIDFVERIGKHIEAPLKLHSAKLAETDNSFCTWFASDNE